MSEQLETTVERVAQARPCPTCEGTGWHPPGDTGGLGCWDCHDGTLDGRGRIVAILRASGLPSTLEAACASIRWRDVLAEEWSAHMRALTAVLDAANAIPDPGFPRPDWYLALREVIDATDSPADHTYTRESKS